MAEIQRTILLIEDNPKIMAANEWALSKVGYEIVKAMTIMEARELLTECSPDAIVLDILLPDGNGLDFIKEIRKHTLSPVLLLTSLTDKQEQLDGLRAGGDDYITKPYDVNELRERIAAFIRRQELLKENVIMHTILRGPLTLDTVSQQAFLNGQDMLLTPKEFALLFTLVQNEGRFVDSDTLYKTAWKRVPNQDVRTIYTHISLLNRKLAGDKQLSIKSARGKGYCFTYIDSLPPDE